MASTSGQARPPASSSSSSHPTRSGCSATSSAPGAAAKSPGPPRRWPVLSSSVAADDRARAPRRRHPRPGAQRRATERSWHPLDNSRRSVALVHRPSVPQLHLPQDAAPFASGAVHGRRPRRLVYPGPRRSIRAIDVITGETQTLGGCLDDMCYPSLSPDGTRLAYGAEEHLKIQTIDTGGRRADPHPRCGVDQHARLVARRDTASRSPGPRGLYTVDVESGEVRRVAPVRPPIGRTSSSASGRRTVRTIAFLDPSPRPGPNHEYPTSPQRLCGPTGRDPREVHDAGHCACLGLPAPSLTWSPDGELIAVAVTQSADGAGIFTIRNPTAPAGRCSTVASTPMSTGSR